MFSCARLKSAGKVRLCVGGQNAGCAAALSLVLEGTRSRNSSYFGALLLALFSSKTSHGSRVKVSPDLEWGTACEPHSLDAGRHFSVTSDAVIHDLSDNTPAIFRFVVWRVAGVFAHDWTGRPSSVAGPRERPRAIVPSRVVV